MGSIPKTHSLNKSAQNPFHHFTVHIGEPVVAPLITVGEAFMVNPHEVLNGRVKVMHMDRILGDVVTPIVCLTVGDAALYAATSKPYGKAAWMMVTAKSFCIAALAVDRASEFSAPDD